MTLVWRLYRPMFVLIAAEIALSGGILFGQFDLNLNPLGQPGADKPAVTVTGWFTVVPNGDSGTLYVQAVTEGQHYIYGVDQPAGDGPIPTRIKVDSSADYEVGPFRPLKAPKREYSEVFEVDLLTQQGTITWAAPIKFQPGTDAKGVVIRGQVTAQPCTKEYCTPPTDFSFVAKFQQTTAEEPAVVPPPDEVQSSDDPITTLPSPTEGPPDPSAVSEPAGPGPKAFDGELAFEPRTLDTQSTGASALPWIIATAFLGGLLLNLMPCVLPVIGLKVLSFVEQSGHSAHKAFMLNAWYSLGLLSVFWILASLAAFLGFGWGELFTYSEFNIALAAIVFVMGLSFLGVWELPIPGFVGSGHMAELGEKEGATGAFVKGVITTILATPCTAPFLGTALAFAVTRPTLEIYLIFTAVGLGMALPYLIIGAFPRLTAFIPKPGAWMETFKQIMGFVLLGTVIFLLTFLRWYYMVPTVGLLFGLWAACWWINRVPITAEFQGKAKAWVQAALFAAFVWVLMFPGTRTTLASLGKPFAFPGLAGVLQARLEGQSERWRPFTMEAFEAEMAEGRPVMIDFTADWCLVCQTLEATVLYTDRVNEAIDRYGVVTFKADWTHRDPDVTRMLEKLGAKQVPVLAFFSADDPTRPIVLRGGYTTGNVLEALRKSSRQSAEAEDRPTR